MSCLKYRCRTSGRSTASVVCANCLVRLSLCGSLFFSCRSLFLGCGSFLYNFCGSFLGCGSVLSHNCEGHLNGNLLVELHACYELADFLNVLDDDGLAVDFKALFLECLSNVEGVDGAVNRASLANLGSNDDGLDFAELLGESFCVSLDLGELVCALLEFFFESLQSALACDDSLTSRNKIVASVTVLDVYDVVLFLLLGYFIKSVTNGSRARWRARFTA